MQYNDENVKARTRRSAAAEKFGLEQSGPDSITAGGGSIAMKNSAIIVERKGASVSCNGFRALANPEIKHIVIKA